MLATLTIAAACTRAVTGRAEDADVARGKYLVELGGCAHCHTPGFLAGKPDPSRYLGGSDLGFEVAGLGTFVGPNLTPDMETGLGAWTKDEVIAAIRTGVRPDGRMLIPIMPWRDFAVLTDADAAAIVDYLRTLPPVVNKVPGPFGPDEKPAITRMRVVPPQDAARLERTE
jgi:mono/diheme cytochrome c family protein